jgi:hypothetical protein
MILFAHSFIFGQEDIYYVLHTEGKIEYAQNKMLLTVGDQVKGNPDFIFSSSKAKAFLWHKKQKGLYLKTSQKNKPQKFLSHLTSLKNYNKTNDLEYLFFSGKNLLSHRLVKAFLIPKNKASYYFIEFLYQGKVIRKKLPINKQGLLSINNNVLDFTNKPINIQKISKAHIGFYDANNTQLKIMEGVQFQFVDIKQSTVTINQIKVVLEQQGVSISEIKDEVGNFLKRIYGPEISISWFIAIN